MKRRSTALKIVGTISIAGAAASVAGLGTFGSFTSTTSASQTVSSGTVVIALGTAGTANNRLTIGASNLKPGDTIDRAVTLSNTGTLPLASVALTTTATTSSKLDTDATNGLQMTIKSCSVAWTEGGTAPAYTYTCSGTTTTVLASQAVIGSGLNLPSLNSLTAGGTDYLEVHLLFPTTADNTFQNLTSTIQYAFTGTQTTGAPA